MTPGQFDPALIERHLLALGQAVKVLRNHQGRSLEELASDQEERWIVERGLQLCAQNTLDIAIHLAARAGRDVPDYTAAIDRLADLGVLPSDFAASFRGMAGFRNVLVHGYLDVEDRKSTRLNSSHSQISYAVFCLKKKKKHQSNPHEKPLPHRHREPEP